MLVDLKIKSTEDMKDMDLLVYSKKENAMVPISREKFIEWFGFNLDEINKTITNTNTRIKNAEGLANEVAATTKNAIGRVAQRQVNFVKIFKGGIKK